MPSQRDLPAPQSARRPWIIVPKAILTVGVFYVLCTHPIVLDGQKISVWQALSSRVSTLSWDVMAPYLLAAALLKAVGITCAMVRWHLLLVAQGVRFNFGHVVGSFLIGRFLGTFLPGTVGLDGYKLYDATRYSGRVAEPVTATVVEKSMGLCGMALTFGLSAPFGYAILGADAPLVLACTLPLAALMVGGICLVLWRPGLLQGMMTRLAGILPKRLTKPLLALSRAAAAYAGRGDLLAVVLGLSFLVHFTTASMYVLTALAVGAHAVHFGEVVFASSIQIFATVLSPFTIAGEGVREVVQALLLAKRLGATESILSAALGFWAAEALTLVGGYFWWRRTANYRPRQGAMMSTT